MDYQSQLPKTMCLSKITLAAGTTTTLSNTGTTTYAINGRAYTKAAMTNAATPTTDAATLATFLSVKANKGCVFTIGFNAAGDLKAVQGSIVDLDASGAFIQAPQFGAVPNDFCPVGFIVIKAGNTADATTGWVFGTSNMSSVTGVTYDFNDLISLPDRPQIT